MSRRRFCVRVGSPRACLTVCCKLCMQHRHGATVRCGSRSVCPSCAVTAYALDDTRLPLRSHSDTAAERKDGSPVGRSDPAGLSLFALEKHAVEHGQDDLLLRPSGGGSGVRAHGARRSPARGTQPLTPLTASWAGPAANVPNASSAAPKTVPPGPSPRRTIKNHSGGAAKALERRELPSRQRLQMVSNGLSLVPK